MPTEIPEEMRRKLEAALVSEMGLTPGEVRLQIGDDGQPQLLKTGATDKGWLSALGKRAGERALGGLATVPAGIATTALAEPLITGAAGAAAATGVGAPAAPFIELGGNALAFMGGQMGAQAALDATGASDKILQQFGDTRDQVEYDRNKHPWASAAGDMLGSAATFQVNPRTIGKNVGALATTLLTRKFKDEAAKAAVRQLTQNVAGNVGVTTAQQLYQNGEVKPGDLLQSAVEGAVLGAPRALPQAMGNKLAGMGKSWLGMKSAPMASPSDVATVAEAPPVMSEAAPVEAPPVEAAPPPPLAEPTTAEKYYGDAPDISTPVPMTAAEKALIAARRSIRAQQAGRPSVPRLATTAAPAPEGNLSPEGLRLRAIATEQAIREAAGQNVAGASALERPPIVRSTEGPTADSLEWLRLRGEKPKQNFVEQLPDDATRAAGRFQQEDFGDFDPNTMSLEQWRAQRKARSFRPAADAPTPEPAAVLAEAVQAAADPSTTKAAAFIPAGSPAVEAPGLVPVPMPKGVVLVNPQKANPTEPVTTPDGQIRGTLLGLSQETKPATAHPMAVVTDKPGAPAVLTEIVDSPAAAQRAAAAQATAVPGGTQRLAPPAAVVKERATLLSAENQNTTGRSAAPAPSPALPANGPAAQPPAKSGGGAPAVPLKSRAPEGLGTAQDFEPVPMSIVDRAFKMSPTTGKAVADYHSDVQAIYGKYFNTLLDRLRGLPRDVVNSAIAKRLQAYKTKQPPQFTPEEAQINAMYDATMKATAAEATAAGYPIAPEAYYVPQIFNEHVARRAETEGDAFLAREIPLFHQHNAAIDPSYNPAEGEGYARDYIAGVSKAPNSLGSDFAALTKYARQFHLPPEWLEPDFQRGLQRYGQRFASQVAYKRFIEPNTEAMANLYNNGGNAATPAMQNARMGVEGVLFNEGRGSSGMGQNTKDLISSVQQAIYSSVMQTATGVANTVQKAALHMGLAEQTAGGFKNLVEATNRTITEWQTQRAKAIQSGLVRPGHDPSIITEDAGPVMETARTLRNLAQKMRWATGGEFLETMNRVHDFTIGEGLARINTRLLAKGDADAVRFINRFGAGITKTMPHEEQVMRMARNYAEALQSSYSMVGLPAPMLKGGVVGQLTRIQRFGWENMMRTHQYVVKPAIEKGEYGPLVAYLFGAAVTAPILAKIREVFSGRPSGMPTEAEIAAGKKSPGWEHVLDIMQGAQLSGAFGTAGSALGSVASNIRGGHQSLTGDPALSFAVSLMTNLGHAAEAMRQGEPGVPVLAELAKRTLVDNVQVLRRFGQDSGEATDRRNKAVYEYLTEARQQPIGDMVKSLVLGGVTPTRTPEISPTKEAARAGDQVALQRLTPEQRTALDNYPGGYEDQMKEAKYQQWLARTQPDQGASYRARRLAYKSPKAAQ